MCVRLIALSKNVVLVHFLASGAVPANNFLINMWGMDSMGWHFFTFFFQIQIQIDTKSFEFFFNNVDVEYSDI